MLVGIYMRDDSEAWRRGGIKMKTEKEVLEALKTLQEVCKENDGKCKNCLLRNGNNDCGVMFDTDGDYHETLMHWDLLDYSIPRLLLG